jgi:hypothetical protein
MQLRATGQGRAGQKKVPCDSLWELQRFIFLGFIEKSQ